MKDFTPETYRALLHALKRHGRFTLRHDVDLYPLRSLHIAEIEASEGLQATYYFRTVPESYDESIIRQIVALGHDAGYHYECLTTCQGDINAALADFQLNLAKLRSVVPIAKACAHGSPRSPHNSMDLWQHQDYHTFGIEHESMLDTDFSTTLYLTDTGRRWDGYRVSVRDKVPQYQDQWSREGLVFHTTDDLILALNNVQHPIHTRPLLINTHPQRWIPFGTAWVKEAAVQRAKNIVKQSLIAIRNRK